MSETTEIKVLQNELKGALLEIDDLKRDYAVCADSLQSKRDIIDDLETMGVIEMMNRNVNVDSFVREKEVQIVKLRGLVKEAYMAGRREGMLAGRYAKLWCESEIKKELEATNA